MLIKCLMVWIFIKISMARFTLISARSSGEWYQPPHHPFPPPRPLRAPYTYTNSCLHCSVAVTRLKQAIIWVMWGVWCRGGGVMTVWVGEGVVGGIVSSDPNLRGRIRSLVNSSELNPSLLLISRTDKISDPESAESLKVYPRYAVTRSRTDKL